MIDELQNDLITTEAAVFLKNNSLQWKCARLQYVYDADLCHTRYYQFVLKSVTVYLMTMLDDSSDEWDKEIDFIKDNPKLLRDLLTHVGKWSKKPWREFLKKGLAEFLV